MCFSLGYTFLFSSHPGNKDSFLGSSITGQFIGDIPRGQWIDKHEYFFLKNQKQGFNLVFNGYMYKKEASFRATVNWICSDGNGKRLNENKCSARAITKFDGGIKLGKNAHNHPPRFLGGKVPAKLMPKDAFYPQY
ncbi:GM11016 [Drosophila sechellia]|uniref:GM11016 n=1 Tax=Drosophila sechellia TaxID=7238 RepID=B4I3H4_DROSE|nr:GM11016 [Drosophila sechellia]